MRGSILLFLLALATGGSGCAFPEVDLSAKSCPCTDGWRCEPGRNVCVRDEATDGGASHDGAVDAPFGDAAATDAMPRDTGPSDAAEDRGPVDAGEPGLVAWYTMDAAPAGGRLADATGHGHDAECSRCPPTVEGRVGFAIDLDGTMSLRIPHDAAFDGNQLTVAVWVRTAAPSTEYIGIVARPHAGETTTANSWALFHVPSEGALFETYDGTSGHTVVASGALALGAWKHVAATVDAGGTQTLYVDGAAIAARTSPIALDASDILIGADLDNGVIDGFFVGQLDDVRIYDRALAADEIAALAAAP